MIAILSVSLSRNRTPSTTPPTPIAATVTSPFSGSLFARHFLDEGVRETLAWRSLSDDRVRALRTTLESAVSSFGASTSPNEATTEQELILPVLVLLGWSHTLPQQGAGGRGRSDVPDRLLFASAEDKAAALAEPREEERYRHGISFLEAKRWQRPLDRGENGGAPDPGTPSAQMLRYLSRAEAASERRIQWGMLTNGRHWRLYWQGARSRAEEYFEVDADALSGDQPGADDLARLFVLVFGRDAFVPDESDPQRRPFLRLAREESRFWEELVSRDLGKRVFEEIFPRLLEGLARHDSPAPAGADAAFLDELRQAALTLLYRLLFVLYAEDRRLLPVGDERYDRYSLHRLRLELGRRLDAGEAFSARAYGIDQRLRDLFAATGEGDGSIGLPPCDGGLFDRGRSPLLERVRLPDAELAPLLDALSRRREPDGRHRWINYRDLSVQHLGSIYERLFEREPAMVGDRIVLRPQPAARKSSGSYYTPDSLVRRILEEAVGPLVADAVAGFETAAEALAADRKRTREERLAALAHHDPAARLVGLRICDPAMGSGHFLVSLVDYLTDHVLEQMALVESAVPWAPPGKPYRSPLAARIEQVRLQVLDNARREGWAIDASQLDDRHIVRRIVLKRVVYGVDKNPMAVDLAKVALWLHSFTAGAPLSFLDPHLRVGDSLHGEWSAAIVAAFDRVGALWLGQERAKVAGASRTMAELARIADSDVAEVRRSQQLHRQAEGELASLRRLFDFWHALRWIDPVAGRAPGAESHPGVAPLLRGVFGSPLEVLAAGRVEARFAATAEAAAVEDLLGRVREVAARERFLHWELAFPEVWTSDLESPVPGGGFDAVVGNPPWERIRLQEVEWLATRAPAIARAGRAADRKREVARLARAGDPLWEEYRAARERAEAGAAVLRRSGDYPLLGRGDLNLYSLFVERAERLVEPRGVVGLLVPSGIASDKGAAPFFRSIAAGGRLAALYDFENRRGFFPDVDSRFKFSILVFGGAERSFPGARLAFFLHAVDELDDGERSFRLAPRDLAAVNPNTGTAPFFRTRRSATIVTAVHGRLPVLVDRRGDEPRAAWPVEYLRMFDMTGDSALFHTAAELEAAGYYRVAADRWQRGDLAMVPLYEGKMVQLYDHRAASVVVHAGNLHRPAQGAPASEEQHRDPEWLPEPQFWVDESRVPRPGGLAWTIGLKDVTAATNARTTIAAILPLCALGNTLPALVPAGRDAAAVETYLREAPLLLATLNSLVFDFVARQKVQGQHLNLYILEQLPVPRRDDFERRLGGRRAADFVREQVLRLSYTAVDLAPFARDLGHAAPPHRWDDEDRRHRMARLDALFFHLYGLDRDDAEYVLDQFPIVREADERRFGRFRTRDLVLGYFGAVAAGELEATVRA
jgi:hypothetical protein